MSHLTLEMGVLLVAAFFVGCLGGAIAKSVFRNLAAAKVPIERKVVGERNVALAEQESPDLEDRPDGLSGPRHDRADDLKRINGIGPRIEALLNDLGIYHFDQIARWSDENVEWVDANLNFFGRVNREAWIQQAEDLATGTAHTLDSKNDTK